MQCCDLFINVKYAQIMAGLIKILPSLELFM
jgi:hypothetical protein